MQVGATGKQLVEQLLIKGYSLKIVVRSPEKLPESWKNNVQLKVITASILDLSDSDLKQLVY